MRKIISFVSFAVAAAIVFFCETSTKAQVPADLFRLFGGVMQSTGAQAARNEWRRLPREEVACVERTLRERGSSLQTVIGSGVGPNDPRVQNVRSSCSVASGSDDVSADAPVILSGTYHFVANTNPPGAFLALRSEPSTTTGSRLTKMPNGTLLQVLDRRNDGWWFVRIAATNQTGWALKGQSGVNWIECCKTISQSAQAAPSGETTATLPQPASPLPPHPTPKTSMAPLSSIDKNEQKPRQQGEEQKGNQLDEQKLKDANEQKRQEADERKRQEALKQAEVDERLRREKREQEAVEQKWQTAALCLNEEKFSALVGACDDGGYTRKFVQNASTVRERTAFRRQARQNCRCIVAKMAVDASGDPAFPLIEKQMKEVFASGSTQPEIAAYTDTALKLCSSALPNAIREKWAADEKTN
jgi:hypothetical protein